MADPISLAAIAGLIYAGRTLSNKKAQVSPVEMQRRIVEQTPKPPAVFDRIEPLPDMSNLYEPRVEIPHKKENDSFAVISAQHRTNGQEVLSMRDRMFDTGRMNNLSPIEKQLVGPGLGVGADVPASGGYQQLVRVNPINVGEHRLTTLPGRTGPAADVTGGRSAVIGQLTHNKPDTTTYLPSRLPTVMGRAQGMTGLIPRQEHEKTKRITNRSETGNRTDGLGFNGAKRFVSAQALPQDPTRFKSDRNDLQSGYYNQAQPGISNHVGAYTNSAAVQVANKTNEELMKYGFRPEDRRGKANRLGNKGRMNVRESALKQGGALTAVRSDTSRVDGRVGGANGGWTQNYKQESFHKFNSYKGHENPHTRTLDIAKKQMSTNPLAQSIY
jgi:hypothetical protein